MISVKFLQVFFSWGREIDYKIIDFFWDRPLKLAFVPSFFLLLENEMAGAPAFISGHERFYR